MKTISSYLFTLASLSVLFMLSSCAGGAGKKVGQLDAAGATFPFPFYDYAFKEYKKEAGVSINYGAIGSGGGIRNLKDEIVDFAATDAFLSDKELQEMKPTIHIPTCIGAVVLGYKLEGITDLKLTGKLISDIYRGKITRWDDHAIAEINPNSKLPNKAIIPVYRSDGSGTTQVFSHYLSEIDGAWKDEIGTGKSLSWPVGQAAKGNPGVAGIILQTEGAIGYIGSEYSHAMNLPMASIQNRAGNFVPATLESISAAASSERFPADTRTMITNAAAEDAYPISTLTWIVLFQEQHYKGRSLEQAIAVKALLEWMISPTAQTLAEKVNYASLPLEMRQAASKQLSRITFDGEPIDTQVKPNRGIEQQP